MLFSKTVTLSGGLEDWREVGYMNNQDWISDKPQHPMSTHVLITVAFGLPLGFL